MYPLVTSPKVKKCHSLSFAYINRCSHFLSSSLPHILFSMYVIMVHIFGTQIKWNHFASRRFYEQCFLSKHYVQQDNVRSPSSQDYVSCVSFLWSDGKRPTNGGTSLLRISVSYFDTKQCDPSLFTLLHNVDTCRYARNVYAAYVVMTRFHNGQSRRCYHSRLSPWEWLPKVWLVHLCGEIIRATFTVRQVRPAVPHSNRIIRWARRDRITSFHTILRQLLPKARDCVATYVTALPRH